MQQRGAEIAAVTSVAEPLKNRISTAGTSTAKCLNYQKKNSEMSSHTSSKLTAHTHKEKKKSREMNRMVTLIKLCK